MVHSDTTNPSGSIPSISSGQVETDPNTGKPRAARITGPGGREPIGAPKKGKDKGKEPAQGRRKDSESLDDLTASGGGPKGDRAIASERVLMEQVEQDERLHQSQAKIKVIGLDG